MFLSKTALLGPHSCGSGRSTGFGYTFSGRWKEDQSISYGLFPQGAPLASIRGQHWSTLQEPLDPLTLLGPLEDPGTGLHLPGGADGAPSPPGEVGFRLPVGQHCPVPRKCPP